MERNSKQEMIKREGTERGGINHRWTRMSTEEKGTNFTNLHKFESGATFGPSCELERFEQPRTDPGVVAGIFLAHHAVWREL